MLRLFGPRGGERMDRVLEVVLVDDEEDELEEESQVI